jgi:hypothetical protein
VWIGEMSGIRRRGAGLVWSKRTLRVYKSYWYKATRHASWKVGWQGGLYSVLFSIDSEPWNLVIQRGMYMQTVEQRLGRRRRMTYFEKETWSSSFPTPVSNGHDSADVWGMRLSSVC